MEALTDLEALIDFEFQTWKVSVPNGAVYPMWMALVKSEVDLMKMMMVM
jgi:hypothetical protein